MRASHPAQASPASGCSARTAHAPLLPASSSRAGPGDGCKGDSCSEQAQARLGDSRSAPGQRHEQRRDRPLAAANPPPPAPQLSAKAPCWSGRGSARGSQAATPAPAPQRSTDPVPAQHPQPAPSPEPEPPAAPARWRCCRCGRTAGLLHKSRCAQHVWALTLTPTG